MNEFIMVLAILILVGYGVLFMKKAEYNQAPKIIWTYWEEPEQLDPKKRLSDHAKHAIRSWEEHHPNYEIILLTKKTYQGYVTIPEEIRTHPALNPDYLRDLIKLWILTERGGVWIDPEIILNKPLDPWLFPKYGELAAVIDRKKTSDPIHPVIDPRLIACNKGSIAIKRWRDEFSEIIQFPNVEQYIEHRNHIDHQRIHDPIKDVIQITQLISWNTYPKESLILHPTNPNAQ